MKLPSNTPARAGSGDLGLRAAVLGLSLLLALLYIQSMTTLRLGGGLAAVWLAPRYAGLGAKDLFMLAFIGLGLLELMNLCLSWRRLGRRQSARHWMPTLATLSLIAGCLVYLDRLETFAAEDAAVRTRAVDAHDAKLLEWRSALQQVQQDGVAGEYTVLTSQRALRWIIVPGRPMLVLEEFLEDGKRADELSDRGWPSVEERDWKPIKNGLLFDAFARVGSSYETEEVRYRMMKEDGERALIRVTEEPTRPGWHHFLSICPERVPFLTVGP